MPEARADGERFSLVARPVFCRRGDVVTSRSMETNRRKGKSANARRPAEEGEKWVDRMRRWTLVFPKEMIEEVKAEARRSGRTHSRVVVDAVRKALQ